MFTPPPPQQCPKIENGETFYFSENPVTTRAQNRTTGEAPRSDHNATYLCVYFFSSIIFILFFSIPCIERLIVTVGKQKMAGCS